MPSYLAAPQRAGVFSLLAATEITDGVFYPVGGFGKVRRQQQPPRPAWHALQLGTLLQAPPALDSVGCHVGSTSTCHHGWAYRTCVPVTGESPMYWN
jgi:hypothetical protein